MTVIEVTRNMKKSLPTGWRWVKLGEVCKFTNGDAYRESDWSNHGTPIIRIQNLNDPEKPFNYWAGSLDKKVCVRRGDLLLAWSGTPGTSFGAHIWEGDLGVLNQHIFLVRFSNGALDAKWAKYAINHALDDLIQAAHGAVGLAHVTRKEVDSLQIALPPINEQKRIAAILNEQMAAVEKARESAQARLEAAKRLPAAFMEQHLEGPRAATWPRVNMTEVCKIIATQVDPKLPEFRDLPHVNGENIESGTGSIFGIRSAAEDRMTSGKYLFDPPVVVYSKLRPYLRKAAAINFRGLCSADMYPLAFDHNRVDTHFALWVLLSRSFTEYAIGESQRSRMPKLNRDQLFSWKFPVPLLAMQRSIVSDLTVQIRTSKQVITSLREELQIINALPAALLRRAFNGDI